VFTARYALSPYIKQIRFVFKGLTVSYLTKDTDSPKDQAINAVDGEKKTAETKRVYTESVHVKAVCVVTTVLLRAKLTYRRFLNLPCLLGGV
jgi:hypothetical protein